MMMMTIWRFCFAACCFSL